jgi:type VI secretion system protein ImpJ
MQKVLWTKGVLLTPQHLQAQDRYLEDQLRFQLAAAAYCPWGFRRLEIDREALGGGVLSLVEASGLMPDGLPFDVPASDLAPAPRPLAEHWNPDADSLDVWLAVPELRFGGYNVSTNGIDRQTRYFAEVVTRRDENTGKMEKPIQVARRNLRLLVEGEVLDGHSALQVARVTRSRAGVFQIDSGFVPPLIDVAASEHLMAIARRLVEILSAKSTTLSAGRRQRSQGLADFGVADVANFWLLYTVNTWLPVLRHVYETRRGHPADLFEAMLGLGGALSTFSTTIHPRMLPEYDHGRLSDCFSTLDAQVREMLETVVPSNHASLPLRMTEPAVYAAALDQERYLQASQVYLAIHADVKPDELLRRVPQLLKISSADQIDRLIKRALAGVALSHVANPPSALPVRLEYQYFALEMTGPDWEAIKVARNLAVYVPSDLPNPRLELILLFPPGRK